MANPYFNAVYYLQQNPDVFSAGYTVATAWDHYVKHGANEANVVGGTFRAPNPWFDVKYYLANNPDLVRAGITPATALDHFLTYGSTAGEDRAPNATIAAAPITEAKLLAYAKANADLQTAFGISASATTLTAAQQTSLLNHFYAYGYNETRADKPAAVTIPDVDAGKTFTLTTNADNIVGTSGDDLVTGVNNGQVTTFSAVDSIDGGAGVDTLKLELNANYAGGAAIKNIEKLSLTMTAGGAFDTNGIAGLTNVAVNAGVATTFQNLANVVDAEISNTAVATTLQFADAAVAGASDKVNVTLNNVTGAAAVNVDSVTALAAGVEEVGFITSGANSSVTLASNDSTIAKVTVEGDKNLTLALNAGGGNTQTSVRTVDASALTGNLSLSGLGAVNHTVTGGSGNDTFNFGANFAVGDTVDGGAGTDTLAVTQAITAAQWAGVKNIETVAFTSAVGVTQDASLLTGVTTFNISGAATQTLNKLAADAKVGVVGNTTTLTASLADVTGLTDALNLSLNTGSGAAAVTLGTLTNVAGIEQVNIVTNGNSNAVVNVITTDNVTAKHVITGAASLQFTNAVAATVIDASGMTGNLTVLVGSGGNDNYQGGSGNDTLFGNAGNDVLVGNAGNDRLNGGAGNDTLKGGEGVDTFAFTGIDLNGAGAGTAQGVDHITDFVAGTDKIALVGVGSDGATALATATVAATAINVATAANVAAIITAIGNSAAVSTASNATVTQVNVAAGDAAGTYLFVNDGTLAASATDDVLINITGVSGTITANDFVFV